MLKELNISYTNITDASLIAKAKNCTELQLLDNCECEKLCSDKLRHHFSIQAAIYPTVHLSILSDLMMMMMMMMMMMSTISI